MQILFWAEIGGPQTRYRMLLWELASDPVACCDDMATWWDSGMVGVTLCGFSRPENLTACIRHGLTSAVTPISYCPSCGERIDLGRVEDHLLSDPTPPARPAEGEDD